MSKISHNYLITLILIHLILISCSSKDRIDNKTTKVAKVKLCVLYRTITVLGSVVPAKKENITSELSGILKKIFVTNGERVIKGQKLLRIDSSYIQYEKYLLAQQQILRTQLEIKLIKEELNRLKRLSKLNQISEKQLDELKIKLIDLKKILEIDKKLLRIQKDKIDNTLIIAPSSGMVLSEIPLEKGTFIRQGQQMFSLISSDSVIVKARLNQDEALRIKIGQHVIIKGFIEGHKEMSIPGKINFIGPKIQNGWIDITVALIRKVNFKIGITVKVDISFRSKKMELIVPIEAVRIYNNQSYVFTLEKGKIKKRNVVIGDNDYKYVEILKADSLFKGSKVIISNFDKYEKNFN